MNQFQEKLLTWYSSLSDLDQKVLMLVGLIAVSFILYTFIWSPVAQNADLQHQRVLGAEQELQWLYQASSEVRALRGQNNKPLKDILDMSLKRHKLQPDSKKFDQNVSEWRLRFKATDFRKLLLWLNELRRQSTVVIALANISREPAGGVNARFVLTENR